MRIGELVKRSGVSRDTIRLYERKGLLQSHANCEATNAYRDYPEDCVMTLDLIDAAQAAGMTLADVAMFMAQMNAEGSDDFDGIDFLDAKIEEVASRLERAGRFLETLRDTRSALLAAPFEDELGPLNADR